MRYIQKHLWLDKIFSLDAQCLVIELNIKLLDNMYVELYSQDKKLFILRKELAVP